MKQIKSILINTICIVSLFGLMSCIKEIDLESLRPDPTLVVNCVAITGEPLTVSVSRTWFFTDDHPNVTLDKAEVNLFVNGVFINFSFNSRFARLKHIFNKSCTAFCFTQFFLI